MSLDYQSSLTVCSWSLQPANPAELLARLRETGLNRLQIALDPLREQPEAWGGFSTLAASEGVELVSGMFGCLGEDYSTMESIRRTGGIVPDETWDENQKRIREVARLAGVMRLPLVTFHAGFLPHHHSDASYATLIERLRAVAGEFDRYGVELALETGQETAETLAGFLSDLSCKNVGVNFDPANMILYEKGDPIAALRRLLPLLKQCHVKDARKTQVPGMWGEEVPVGTGEVDWSAFARVLNSANYQGHCCIEREAGVERVRDIRTARDYLSALPGGWIKSSLPGLRPK